MQSKVKVNFQCDAHFSFPAFYLSLSSNSPLSSSTLHFYSDSSQDYTFHSFLVSFIEKNKDSKITNSEALATFSIFSTRSCLQPPRTKSIKTESNVTLTTTPFKCSLTTHKWIKRQKREERTYHCWLLSSTEHWKRTKKKKNAVLQLKQCQCSFLLHNRTHIQHFCIFFLSFLPHHHHHHLGQQKILPAFSVIVAKKTSVFHFLFTRKFSHDPSRQVAVVHVPDQATFFS